MPGILGGWRADLQGKQRPDSPRQEVDRDVIVTTSFGQVQGFRVNLYDNPLPEQGYRPWLTPVERIQAQVTVFLGIPYALPPTNEARFKPPRAHPGWQMVQAVDFGPACPQPVRFTGATKGIRDMHEDCLYLNIYTPSTSSGLAQPYPVIVYIHGGEFYHGASNLFPGHVMAAFYNVVVVTLNYRLGALGFLSTGDVNSPGNYGILDQAMALQWIYSNIQFFNGDRNSITLLGGAGAGGASAGLLMLNPRTRNIVTKSGSALADWALILDRYRAQNTSRVFGQQVGCSIESSYKLVDCIKRGRNFYELGNAEFQPEVGTFPWGPVLDKGFTVPEDNWYEGWKQEDWFFTNSTPEEQIRNKQFNSGLSYMTGVTTQEAAFLISTNETLSPYFEVDEEWFNQKIKEMVLRYNYTLNPDGIYRAMKYRYTYWPDPKNTTHVREQYIDMMSDFLYRAPTDHMIKLLVEQNIPVYSYVMNTTVEALRLPEWRKYPHNIEHLLLTGAPFMDPGRIEKMAWTDNDRNMSHFFMKAVTDFARFGNPSHTQILGLHFEMARLGDLRYLNLNTTFNSTIMQNYRQTESAFWTWYLPTVIGILVPTYPPSTEFWWEPKEPLQIAFWTVSGTNLLLIVLVVIFCILWRNAKRNHDRYYSRDILMMRDDPDRGIENRSESSIGGNVHEYRDTPTPVPLQPMIKKYQSEPRKSVSTPSLRIGGSNSSLKEMAVSSSPNGGLGVQRSKTPPPKGLMARKTIISDGVPMTDV
ncbi:hypothetical protein AAG570_002353 [Ranatra chinensis]|uniref:Carboxylesterase type B domain-containing protein n=1 Tax=Ranatra chinensis TaxID=642074 RepID=A0ABD0YJK4_9HEMI